MQLWPLLMIFGLVSYCSAYSRSGQRRPSPSPRGATLESGQATWRKTTIANRLFAHRLFNNIARHHSGNILISPFVVSTGLSMALLGAKGKTEKQLMDGLGYSNLGIKRNGRNYTKEDVPRLYEAMLRNMKNSTVQGGHMFTIASRLFGDQSVDFLPGFIKNTERYYGAGLKQLDFAHHPEEARTYINEWVCNKTQDTIQEAIPTGFVSSDTLLTLVSTSYFKGEWENKFTSEPEAGIFTDQDGNQINVNYMRGNFTLQYKFSMKTRSHILILPYKTASQRHRVEMELYLPAEGEPLAVIENLNEDDFYHERRNLINYKVELMLPKFRLNFDIDLVETLKRLEIKSLFGDADLSGMNGKLNLNLGTAIHKTFMEVNEEGTTASSSISLGSNKSANHIWLEFTRTFILIIREKFTDTILFMGRIDRPQE